MSTKTGRNDPCPCGSGRKYKLCHGRGDNVVAFPDGAERAVERALRWLGERRRKAFTAEIRGLFDSLVLDEEGEPTIDTGDRALMTSLDTNITEWLLADGSMLVAGREVRIADELLGPDGPSFSAAQRQRIEQLRDRPMRLYTVTDVRPGEGMTLCDALDDDAAPIAVREVSGSRSMQPGMTIGARVIRAADGDVLSGAIYPFALLGTHALIAAVRAAADRADNPFDRRVFTGLEIAHHWIGQYAPGARQLPKLVEASSGEPLLLITDHYRVLDAAALAAALAAQDDVSGDAGKGWRREFDGDDGLVRSSVVINPGRQPGRIEVFFRTQRRADEGRVWFDAVAGGSVTHLTREVVDPRGALGSRSIADGDKPAAPPLSSEELTQALAAYMHKHYENWCDEAIPALGNRTPREAIETPAGLERVKGLLRSYEEGERRQSTTQQRPAFSFQFLWDDLGITR